jgi:archaemetzincin
MQRYLFIGTIQILALLGIAAPHDTRQLSTIIIQPLGTLCTEDGALVKEALEQFYSLTVRIPPPIELPQGSDYKPGPRYRAAKLLDFLTGQLPSDGYRILGLTAADISNVKGKIEDWGVIGVAIASGKACVISSYRCKIGAKDPLQARIRLAKVAVHEIGHTLGLDHCPTEGCLMQDARGKVSTCDGEFDLCTRCRSLLKTQGHTLPDNPSIPWPRH